MKILTLHPELADYLKKHRLERKFEKQKKLFETDLRHPSLNCLNLELLEPKHLRIFSFRLDRKHRAIFFFRDQYTIEVIDINNHYQ